MLYMGVVKTRGQGRVTMYSGALIECQQTVVDLYYFWNIPPGFCEWWNLTAITFDGACACVIGSESELKVVVVAYDQFAEVLRASVV